MFKKLLIASMMIGTFCTAVFADTQFKVRIENVSTPDLLKSSTGATAPAGLSPGLCILTSSATNPAFVVGHPDHGMGLEAQAEDGNPADLAKNLAKVKGVMSVQVFNTPAGADKPGPIGPNGAYEFTFTAKPGTYFTYTQMFGQSNDLFYSPEKPIALFDKNGKPIDGELTAQVKLWDAGTEVNEEPGFGPNQAPRQAAPNTGKSEKEAVRAIEDVKDGFTYPQTAQVFKITITHQ